MAHLPVVRDLTLLPVDHCIDILRKARFGKLRISVGVLEELADDALKIIMMLYATIDRARAKLQECLVVV